MGCLLHDSTGQPRVCTLPSDFSAGRSRARLSTGMQHAGGSRVHARTGDVHKSEPVRNGPGSIAGRARKA